jgi:D-galactose 1-dehydrogenase
MPPIRIAVVGMGKIACDQHLPAIAGDPCFELVGVASPHHRHARVPSHPDLPALLAAVPHVDAVSICTPPQVRYAVARDALLRGCHVMLEKPPAATVSEVVALAELAERQGVALFATWHSREAAAVATAAEWVSSRRISGVTVKWKEDVRVWHPGQQWIWQPGGLGVFDPGINALSILTRIVPGPIVLEQACLSVPANCATPIAARLLLRDALGAPIDCEFDFRQTGPQTWDIEAEVAGGRLVLSKGGSLLHIDGEPCAAAMDREYPNLYTRFALLIRERRSDVDIAPLRLVADAFMCGTRIEVEPFVE